ncbi:3-carboxymuconate cyclase [Luteitalea sp. TBR-22]|nr:3-carboxymuconate cyclase [Luteitalea sp. TBR-22]
MVVRRRTFLAAGAGVLAAALPAAAQRRAGTPTQMHVYIGTYTNGTSKGIYRARLDLATGTVSAPELAATQTNPSFLALHPTRPLLYAISETGTFGDKPTGSVSAYAMDSATGALTALNQVSSGGNGPAHVSVTPDGRTVLVANYGGGTVASYAVGADGRLSEPVSVVAHQGSSVHPKRQTKPYAHSIKAAPSGAFVYAADLGADKVFVYRLDPKTSALSPASPASVAASPGSGPRHMAFHPRAPFLYVINELALTVAVYRRDASTGALTEVQSIGTLPAGVPNDPAFSTAEVQVHPSGRFLYGSNRGHDSLVVFAIDEATGRLTLVQHEPTQGKTPRGFGIDPTGRYLLAGNQRSDTLVVFRIDEKTGRLTPTGQSIGIGAPVSVVFAAVR